MRITFNGNQSFADAAERYTIGGIKYGVALANLVGAKDEYVYPPANFSMEVPDSWIKPEWLRALYDYSNRDPLLVDVTGGGKQPVTVAEQKTLGKWMGYAAIGVLALMLLLTDKKTSNRRNRR